MATDFAAQVVVQRVGVGAAVVFGSFAVGLAVGAVGAFAGPLAMVGLPLVALLAVAMLERPWLGAATVGLVLPVGLQTVPGLPLQVIEVVVLAVAGVLLLRAAVVRGTPKPWARPVGWALAILVVAIAATPSALDPGLALKQLFTLGVSFVAMLVVLGACTSLHDVRRVVVTVMFVAVGITASSLSSANRLRSAYGGNVVDNRLSGVFVDPNELGGFAMVVVLLATGLYLGARTGRQRVLGAVGMASSSAALLLSLSRGSWIGTTFGGLLLVTLLPGARRFLLTTIVPVLMVAGAFVALQPDNLQVQVVTQRLGTVADPGGNPYDDRPAIWAEGRREVVEQPWNGYGPGNFPVASSRNSSAIVSVNARHAHDFLLTVAAEIGLLGAALLIGFTLATGSALCRVIRRLPDRRDAALVGGLAASLFAVVGQGLIDFTLRNVVLHVLVWFVAGLAMVVVRDHGDTTRSTSRPGVRY